MRNPTAGVLKEAHAANRLLLGQLEAVPTLGGHDDQVALLHQHAHPTVRAGANVEDALSFEHEPNFVLVVKVLAVELRADRVEVRRRRAQLDDVLLDVAALGLEHVHRRLVAGGLGREALVEDAFGRENVTVRLFDRKRLSGGSVVQDFLETWEIGAPEEFIATGNQNESVNPAAQEFLRHLNGHVTPIEGLPLDAVLGPLSASLAEHFPGSGAKPARAAAEAFYAMFRASNEAVRVRHFPDLASLFPEDFTSYPETCGEAAATLEDFAAIAAALQVENTRHIRRLEAEICIRDARLAWDKGETAPAMAALGRAVSWLPHHAPTHRIRGEYLLRSGCAAEAAEAARAATAHAPENFEYWHFLGVVLRSLGDLEGARDAQAHAVDLNPAHEPSRTCLEQIEQALAVQPEAPPASVARSA